MKYKNGCLKKMYVNFKQEDYEVIENYINVIIYDHNYLKPSYGFNHKASIEYKTQLEGN